MRITFKKIEIHNFMSFADEVFEFDKHKGLNLVCGKNNDILGAKNGVGKSQLFESLCFSLYGQTRNNIKNVNIHNKYIEGKETRVVAYFEIENNDYSVASGFNKYGAPYCTLTQLVDNDEIDLTKCTIAETRKYLETEILHCDLSIFLRTVLLSSDQNYNFFRLHKGEKKEFIEKLFDISVFGNMYNCIHKDILNKDKDVLSYQNKLLVLNKTFADYKDRIEKYNITTTAKISELTYNLNEVKIKHAELKSLNIKNNSNEVKKYQDALDLVSNAIDDANRNIQKLNIENSKIELAIHKLDSSKDQKQKFIDEHSELLSKICGECTNVFKDYYNINTYVKEINNILESIKQNSEILKKNAETLKGHNDKITKYQNKQTSIQNKIKTLTEEFNKANKNISTLETNMIVIESELLKVQNEKNPYTELFDNIKKEIEEHTKELNDISEKYKYLKFAENIVSQDTLRKFIIADLIGLLNNKIKMYLTKFGAKYNVIFDSNMNYEFIAEGQTYEYDNFSAGERARLMIAACFAFRDFMYIRNNLSSNILILDEFIDGAIDSLAIDSILDILNNFSKIWNQNIFVISHRKEIDNTIFNNIIQVVKTNNIAKITYIEHS